MKNSSRIYLSLTIFFIALEFYLFIRWGFIYKINVFNLLILTPSFIFFMAYISEKKSSKDLFRKLRLALCIIFTIIFVFIFFVLDIFLMNICASTNIGVYEKKLKAHSQFTDEYVKHFPVPIPDDAKNVKFYYNPGFAQGSTYIQLRYSTSPDIIKELYKKYYKKKTRSYLGGEIHSIPFFTSDSNERKFSDDYEFMFLDKNDPSRWNHGDDYGVAINKKRNEIVYFTVLW